MPVPHYEPSAPSTTSWPVDDRDVETADGAEEISYGDPGQTYC